MRNLVFVSVFVLAAAACSGGGGSSSSGGTPAGGGGATQGLSTPSSVSVVPSASE
jgi:hypothetical protein